ncbi:hypothetical protein ABZ318_31445, partial [Streptomyces sp. NPDC006197]
MRGLDGGPDGDGRSHAGEDHEHGLGGSTGVRSPGGPDGRRSGPGGPGDPNGSDGFGMGGSGFGGGDRYATGRRRPRRTVKAVTLLVRLAVHPLSRAAARGQKART